MIALKRAQRVTVCGYREAFDRACARLAREGTPWPFTRKTHALRSAYAVASRHAGVPLPVVALRLGHASERTTERHYFGRTDERQRSPFEGAGLLSSIVAGASRTANSELVPSQHAFAWWLGR